MKDRLRPGHRDDTGRNVVSESERSRSGTTVSVPGLPSSSPRHKAPWPSRQANSHNKFFSTVVPSPPNSIAGCLSLRTKCQLRLYLLRRVMYSPCARYETSVLSQWRRRRLLVLTAGFLRNFGRGRARDENLDRHMALSAQQRNTPPVTCVTDGARMGVGTARHPIARVQFVSGDSFNPT